MINIIKSVLFDCGYEDVVQTEIEFEKLEYKIDIFKNEDVGSQVFIVLQTLESQLVSLSSIKDFIIEIANFLEKVIYIYRIWIKTHRWFFVLKMTLIQKN